MKGRGTRMLDADEPAEGHARRQTAKTHFVIVDAVGVTKSLKTASQPLDHQAHRPASRTSPPAS